MKDKDKEKEDDNNDGCPENFFRLYLKCYHIPKGKKFSMLDGDKYCKSLGTKLAQPYSYQDLISSLKNLYTIEGKNFYSKNRI